MLYQDVLNQIRDLGFSDDAEIQDFGELVPNAINRAITEINLEVAPIVERYEFEIADEDTGYLYLTMPDLDATFLDFADTPVRIRKGDTEMYTSFANYDIEAGDTLVIDQDEHKGEFRVFYKSAHTPFTGTQTGVEVPLPQKVHHLVPLLAAYYVWLEDEPSKAAQYYNLYEQKKQEMQAGVKPRMRILEGGI